MKKSELKAIIKEELLKEGAGTEVYKGINQLLKKYNGKLTEEQFVDNLINGIKSYTPKIVKDGELITDDSYIQNIFTILKRKLK